MTSSERTKTKSCNKSWLLHILFVAQYQLHQGAQPGFFLCSLSYTLHHSFCAWPCMGCCHKEKIITSVARKDVACCFNSPSPFPTLLHQSTCQFKKVLSLFHHSHISLSNCFGLFFQGAGDTHTAAKTVCPTSAAQSARCYDDGSHWQLRLDQQWSMLSSQHAHWSVRGGTGSESIVQTETFWGHSLLSKTNQASKVKFRRAQKLPHLESQIHCSLSWPGTDWKCSHWPSHWNSLKGISRTSYLCA